MTIGDRAPWGQNKVRVLQWLREQEPGTDFYYGDLADELGMPRPTMSAVVRKLALAEPPDVIFGRRTGWYRTLPAQQPDRRQAPAARPAAEKANRVEDLMEVVAVRKDGNLIMRADDGTVWEAKEI
jgi:hypothetical protein